MNHQPPALPERLVQEPAAVTAPEPAADARRPIRLLNAAELRAVAGGPEIKNSTNG